MMAQQAGRLDEEKLCCSICWDVLKDPVTIPCGHSYCMNCIKRHWDTEDQRQIHSCPQCRQTFMPRPALVKNIVLSELLEELKKTGSQAAPADHCHDGPGDVACDVCTGGKMKAVKSCLQCLVSYCEQHLQPHYECPAFKKHKLVDPFERGNICSIHNEVMKIFCRTDQQCICYLCSTDEHKGHDTVSASTERTERQEELKQCRKKIQERIHDTEGALMALLQEVIAINQSADKALRDSEKIFSELSHLLAKRSSDIKQQIRSKQETEVIQTRKLMRNLQEELSELKRKDAELEKLSPSEDNTQFLQLFRLFSNIPESTKVLPNKFNHPVHFNGVAAAVSEIKYKLQNVLCERRHNVSRAVTTVDVLLPQPEPKIDADFLQYSSQLTLDPNTVNMRLLLSRRNRKATFVGKKQVYPSHPERFMNRSQVLSKECLTGRHYWEVEWRGLGIYIAVAYKSITRTADDSEFGNNDKSWALRCSSGQYEFSHNKICQWFSGPPSSKIGVYLDHRAGILSFYSISTGSMTLLHRVQTTFTEPLYAGLRAYHFLGADSSAVVGKLE